MVWWISAIVVILSLYLGISILLYYLQEYFLFKPEKLPPEFEFNYKDQDVEEYNLQARDGAVINGLHFKTENPQGVVLYLKGNSKSIKGWGKFAVDFTRHGYDVFMLDYRGFGKSTGRRTQKNIKHDLQYVYNKIRERVKQEYIILYGRSLGSGFATKLASTNSPRMLILDAPYYSLTKVTKRYLPFMPLSLIMRFPMPTYKWIQYVNCPIHIIHGTNDKLIPFKSSVRLSKINPGRTRLWPIIGGGHKNLHTFESYHRVIHEIMNYRPEEIDLKSTSHPISEQAHGEVG